MAYWLQAKSWHASFYCILLQAKLSLKSKTWGYDHKEASLSVTPCVCYKNHTETMGIVANCALPGTLPFLPVSSVGSAAQCSPNGEQHALCSLGQKETCWPYSFTLQQQYWGCSVLAEGLLHSWAECRADATKTYLPPITQSLVTICALQCPESKGCPQPLALCSPRRDMEARVSQLSRFLLQGKAVIIRLLVII